MDVEKLRNCGVDAGTTEEKIPNFPEERVVYLSGEWEVRLLAVEGVIGMGHDKSKNSASCKLLLPEGIVNPCPYSL